MPSSTDSVLHGIVWRVEQFISVTSSSDLIRSRAQEGEAEGLVIVAGRQTAGRGRHGRTWISPEGNLYVSLLLRPHCRLQDAGPLALVAGLALAEACVDVGADRARLRLKWPNDLIIDELKIGGVLLEVESDQQEVGWVSVGIGVNVSIGPTIPGRASAALLSFLQTSITPAQLLERLLYRIKKRYRDWQESDLSVICKAWASYQLTPGTPILVRPNSQIIDGRYVGIDSDGALLVETDGIHRVTTGEVLFAGESVAQSERLG